MNPTELRIGNWVSHKGEFARVVDIVYRPAQMQPYVIGLDPGKAARVIAFEVDPIKLTPEILQKCGFTVRDDNPKQKPHYEGDVLVDICGYEFTNSLKEGFYSYGINSGQTIIMFVHQLQNFYYAITGTELKVDL